MPRWQLGHSFQSWGGSWSTEQEVGKQDMAQDFCIPGLEKMGEAAADSPVRGDTSTTSSAESWSTEGEWGGTASARSRMSIVKDQHKKQAKQLAVLGKTLNIQSCYALGKSFSFYLPY